MRAWAVAIAAAAALSLSAWVAVETGEQQEERVENVVGESRLGEHAEAGQALLATSVGVLAVLALGLMAGDKGRVARYVGAAGTLVMGVMAYQVGHSGGEMVYQYNAASAYAGPSGTGAAGAGEAAEGTTAQAAKGEAGEKGERGESEAEERTERRKR